jgi:hypothetical protein
MLIFQFPLLSVIKVDIFDFKKNSLEYLLVGINPFSIEPKKKPAIEKPYTVSFYISELNLFLLL